MSPVPAEVEDPSLRSGVQPPRNRAQKQAGEKTPTCIYLSTARIILFPTHKMGQRPLSTHGSCHGKGHPDGCFFVEREEEEKGGYFLGFPYHAYLLIVYL
ncbi:hypothetical protein PY092_16560 [Muricauda sp. 334s03]|uniref:Uncharacterized protein n=1 Tax=Flagellimonas yonaguniensis TaxID=3031325 RepID=A0ABT5Y422_9FLAO|nr:hypothetical protein [[Muricauda] yonaguniensis]MDF0717777.1 hypothetical protein [[Muricauda] yonaguniensis]